MAKKRDENLSDVDQIYNDIRKRISKRYQQRADLFGQLGAFLIVMGVIWLWLQPDGGMGWWFSVFITVGWLIALVIQGVEWWVSELKETAIQREFDRVMAQRGWSEAGFKRKNDFLDEDVFSERLVMLDDEGELVDVQRR
jgi:hypothetical protein